jgi:hypothetical protein
VKALSGGPGYVFIGEDQDAADGLVWSGLFSARWQSLDGASFEQGPQGVSADEAIQWGRGQADVVVIRLGDSDVHYSAGARPPRPEEFGEASVPEWRAGTEVPRRRQRGYEHLDLITDDEIDWEVRFGLGPDVGAHPEYAGGVRAAVEASPGASGVEVEPNGGGGLAVRFVVRARSHAEAVRHAVRVQDRAVAVLYPPTGPVYVGFDPTDAVRPLDLTDLR